MRVGCGWAGDAWRAAGRGEGLVDRVMSIGECALLNPGRGLNMAHVLPQTVEFKRNLAYTDTRTEHLAAKYEVEAVRK